MDFYYIPAEIFEKNISYKVQFQISAGNISNIFNILIKLSKQRNISIIVYFSLKTNSLINLCKIVVLDPKPCNCGQRKTCINGIGDCMGNFSN